MNAKAKVAILPSKIREISIAIVLIQITSCTFAFGQQNQEAFQSSYIHKVSSSIPSLAKHRIPERMNILRAILNVWPEEFIGYVSQPENQAAISGDTQFLECALAVAGFGKVMAGTFTNTSEIKEIAATHGFDPSIAYDVAAGNSEVKQVAIDIMATNEVALLVLTGQKEKFLKSPFYAQKIKTSQLIHNTFTHIGSDLPSGFGEQLTKKAIADLYNKIRLQSSAITSVVCQLF